MISDVVEERNMWEERYKEMTRTKPQADPVGESQSPRGLLFFFFFFFFFFFRRDRSFVSLFVHFFLKKMIVWYGTFCSSLFWELVFVVGGSIVEGPCDASSYRLLHNLVTKRRSTAKRPQLQCAGPTPQTSDPPLQ